MSPGRVEISPGAAFGAALLFYLLRPQELPALLLPVLIHELGHVCAMGILGLRMRCFRAELGGFSLDYTGDTGAWGHALIAAAGPLAGFGYAWAASWLGNRLCLDWLCLSAGLSLLLSLFNLLPIQPLDGGRIFRQGAEALLGRQTGTRLAEWLGILLAALLTGTGAVLLFRRKGAAILLAGLWLLFRAFAQPSFPGICRAGSCKKEENKIKYI